ncbi:MAG: ParB N-terminal domain-containing protein [Spirochaetales bacterium]|nr:ParB N-terminal domain-containing protein [Spirochaetales bacterium]
MQIPVDSIVVRRRIRRELGDIEGLMDSLRRHGQLSSILINRRYELVAGFRRLEAARRLGWSNIDAEFVDADSPADSLELEIEENVQRRQLSTDELADGLQRLKRLREPGLLRRIWLFLVRVFRAIFGRGGTGGPTR